MKLTAEEQAEFNKLAAPYLAHEQVQSMAQFTQHGSVNTLEHCRRVAQTSLWLAYRLGLSVNKRVLVAGALLHDFYLYDWHGAGWHHSYQHAQKACENAVKYFDVDEATQKVICSHMWPISITRVPRSKEAWLVSISDKLVSLKETLFMRRTQ